MKIWDGFKSVVSSVQDRTQDRTQGRAQGQAQGLAMAGKRNPWGKSSGAGDDGSEGDEPEAPKSDQPDKAPPPKGPSKGPRNPWLPPGGGSGGEPPRRSASIEDIFKSRGPEGPRRIGGFGGGSGGPGFSLPPRSNGKSWWPLIIGGGAAALLLISSAHQIQPKQEGLVSWLGGKYARTMGPGFHFTLPWPLQQVTVETVSEIKAIKIGGESEQLILTGDQNLVDLSYIIRWNIKNLPRYTFQLDDPQLTIHEVAEAAMRASVAEQKLDAVVSGEGRAEIEAGVRARMQQVLDAYHSGVAIQGVAIERADPPEKVIDAFKDVSAAQQDANATRNRARAYAQQVLARAEGDAAAFDRIYAQYKLAPEVTRRRLYYETMESVLAKTDKTIIETNGVQSYLPLPEVKRRDVPAPATPAAGAAK